MRDYSELLIGASILICHPNKRMRRTMRGLLRLIGATVTSARNPLEASTVLMRLFSEEEIPDRIVANWWMEEPGGSTYRFWESIGQPEQSTCMHLLKTVSDLEINSDVTIIGSKAKPKEMQISVPASVEYLEVVGGGGKQSALDVVLHTALKENLKKQRFHAVESCRQAMADKEWHDIVRKATSGLETEKTKYLRRQPSQT